MPEFVLPERYASFLRLLSDTKDFSAQMQEYTKRDAAAIIYAFNSLFDISWKLMRDSLFEYYGFDDVKPSPRDIIKKAASAGLISSEADWLLMLKDRNLSTHDYISTNHRHYCEQIRSDYLPLVEQFKDTIQLQINELEKEETDSGRPGGFSSLYGCSPDFPDTPDLPPDPVETWND